MFIRKTTHTDKKNKKEYHTFKLIESVRTERGPRQRMLLNLGSDFSLSEQRWKELANRIEEIVTGQDALFAYPEDIETLAVRYARKVVAYQREPGGEKEKTSDPDYHRVDIDTIDNERSRSVGAEHVVYEMVKTLGLPDLLMTLGLNKPALDTTIGVIAARLLAPSSERATHLWLQDMTALDELLEADFTALSQDCFEGELVKVKNALSKKYGTKLYDKVIEKIGRLKERYKRIARHYEIAVTKDENTKRATSITWERKEQEKAPGVYCLRSNRVDFKEQELFDIFTMLTDIEDAFRSMKSELGLRPVYHQKENRSDGHLFITVLAYHVLHTIRVRLRSQGINDSWTTIRKGLSNHVRITTTMKRDDGKIIHIRKSGRPEIFQKRIYDTPCLPHRPGKTAKTIL